MNTPGRSVEQTGYCESCGTPTRRAVDVVVGFGLPDQHIYSCTPEHDPPPSNEETNP